MPADTFETRSYPGLDATSIHAFDDPDAMTGNGTIALTFLEDLNVVVIPWTAAGSPAGRRSAAAESH